MGQTFQSRRIDTPLDRVTRHSGGKRSYTHTTRKNGRYVSSRPTPGEYEDVALDATLRQASIYQTLREHDDVAITLTDDDIQRKVRVRRAANMIVFAVDASWSMAAAERMEATKGAIMSLLVDAYQKRDFVCLISFQRDQANLVLPPTSSVEMAKRALHNLPVGGKTPLSAGLQLSYRVIKQARQQNPEVMPLLVLLTDGAGNVSFTGRPPHEESLGFARQIAMDHIRAVVINTEHQALDRGLAKELAHAMHAPCYSLGEIKAANLVDTVRRELATSQVSE